MNEKQHTTPTYQQEKTPDRFLRRVEVLKITALASSTLTYLIGKGAFPKPYKLSERMSAWKLSEVVAWMDSRQHATAAGV